MKVNLNKIIELSYRHSADDGEGGTDTSWPTLGEVWASVKPLRGQMLIAAQAEGTRADYTIIIRYRENVLAQDIRVQFDGRTFESVHIAEPDGTRNQWLQMLVREVRV